MHLTFLQANKNYLKSHRLLLRRYMLCSTTTIYIKTAREKFKTNILQPLQGKLGWNGPRTLLFHPAYIDSYLLGRKDGIACWFSSQRPSALLVLSCCAHPYQRKSNALHVWGELLFRARISPPTIHLRQISLLHYKLMTNACKTVLHGIPAMPPNHISADIDTLYSFAFHLALPSILHRNWILISF